MRLRDFGKKLRTLFSSTGKTIDEKNGMKKDEELRDALNCSQEGDLYVYSIRLGELREKFPPVDNFKTDTTEVLQELLRMNDPDGKIDGSVNRKKELILLKKLKNKPSTDDKDAIASEFSNIIEKYKHLLHYILDVKNLKKNKPYVYSRIKDSLIFEKIDLRKYGETKDKSKQTSDEKTNDKSKPNAEELDEIQVEKQGVYWAIENSEILEPFYSEEGKKKLEEKKANKKRKEEIIKEKNKLVSNSTDIVF